MGYLVAVIGLFFYSFTQVDLGLTLSEWSVWQVIQKYFQHIGYFQRPLSGYLFSGIIILLFAFYLGILWAINKGFFSKRQVWHLIIATAVILTFSYNAFSYDLFNYIFDAKIITFYHQNPYLHKALDFTSDPMLSFMHWTHRLYPYGPVWLGVTIPLSFIGMQHFLPTFFLFKILSLVSFIGTVFFIGKILQKFSLKNELFGVAFFALNPLVVIEALVSAHNDVVMMFLSVLAIYLLINKKYIRSFILLSLSIGVKFATAFLLPICGLIAYFQRKKKVVSYSPMFVLMTLFMIIPVILASIRTSFQPWYLLNIFPFAALTPKKHYIFIPVVVFSVFALFEYLPFIVLGNWDNPIPSILFWMTTSAIALSLLFVVAWSVKKVIK